MIEDNEEVLNYERELVLNINSDIKQKEMEVKTLLQVIQKKDQLMEDLEHGVEEESQLGKLEDFILEEKARIILE